jgi:hypothetical protein
MNGDEFEGKAAESLKNEALHYRLKPLRVEEAGAIPGALPLPESRILFFPHLLPTAYHLPSTT